MPPFQKGNIAHGSRAASVVSLVTELGVKGRGDAILVGFQVGQYLIDRH